MISIARRQQAVDERIDEFQFFIPFDSDEKRRIAVRE
jgi:hypothetical protein